MKKTDDAFWMGYMMGSSGNNFDGTGCLTVFVIIVVIRLLYFLMLTHIIIFTVFVFFLIILKFRKHIWRK